MRPHSVRSRPMHPTTSHCPFRCNRASRWASINAPEEIWLDEFRQCEAISQPVLAGRFDITQGAIPRA